jgi:hypothetical protein
MVVIPASNNITILLPVKLGVLVIILVMFIVAFAMALSLCERAAATGEKYR